MIEKIYKECNMINKFSSSICIQVSLIFTLVSYSYLVMANTEDSIKPMNEKYLEEALQFSQEEINKLKSQNSQAFIKITHYKLTSAVEYLEELHFSQEEIKELIIQNFNALTNFIDYRFSITIKLLKKNLQFNIEELKKLIDQNFSTLVNIKAGILKKIISFMEEYIDKEEIKTRLMQNPQMLSESQIQALRKVMPFIDDYIEVDADKGTDETNTWIPLHWLLFAKNVEQILPIIKRYEDKASLEAKHDHYRTPFHWAFFENRQTFEAFFKGEDICKKALSETENTQEEQKRKDITPSERVVALSN